MRGVTRMRLKMSHGAGGEVMKELISDFILKHLATDKGEIPLSALDDSAVIDDIVFTTDSHTVKPIFFPGGDIGSLSVAGTVNDVAVMGAKPLALSLGLVIEEGFSGEDLERVIKSVGETSLKAGVPVVTGDTKVVERGALDKLFTNTSGIGTRTELLDKNLEVASEYRPVQARWLVDSNLADGDAIIVSGTVGDHGIALISVREGYEFESDIRSDVAPVNKMIEKALEAGGVVSCKDPTRGGLSNTLNEWAEKSHAGIIVEEDAIPICQTVQTACDMLGFDPLQIGNEGKAVFGVVPEMAEEALQTLRRTPEGKDAAIIGRVDRSIEGVVLETVVGGRRIVEPPVADPIPRIC